MQVSMLRANQMAATALDLNLDLNLYNKSPDSGERQYKPRT